MSNNQGNRELLSLGNNVNSAEQAKLNLCNGLYATGSGKAKYIFSSYFSQKELDIIENFKINVRESYTGNYKLNKFGSLVKIGIDRKIEQTSPSSDTEFTEVMNYILDNKTAVSFISMSAVGLMHNMAECLGINMETISLTISSVRNDESDLDYNNDLRGNRFHLDLGYGVRIAKAYIGEETIFADINSSDDRNYDDNRGCRQSTYKHNTHTAYKTEVAIFNKGKTEPGAVHSIPCLSQQRLFFLLDWEESEIGSERVASPSSSDAKDLSLHNQLIVERAITQIKNSITDELIFPLDINGLVLNESESY